MALSEREKGEIDAANAAGKPTVMFIHGLWLLAESWGSWRSKFEAAGYSTVAPSWPGDPETVADAKANPQAFAGRSIKEIADHLAEVAAAIKPKPAVVGHSFGGLLTEIVAGRGLSAASVAISPAPFRGVLPLPVSALRVALVGLRNPLNHGRGVPLSKSQFRYGFGNQLTVDESAVLYEKSSVPGPGKVLFQAAFANVNPWTEDKVDTRNPDRGPMLIVSGEHDHTVPWSIASASYKKEKRNPGVTEIVKVPGRGHSLTIDSGSDEVAQLALHFIGRFVKPGS